MSTFMKKLVYGLIGLLAGLAAWPFSETILVFQPYFSSYFMFIIVLGLVFGGLMGGFLGSSEGITLSVKSRIVPGIIVGMILGAVGGAVGFWIGQGALWIVSELLVHSNKLLQAYGIPISRTIGWGFLGVFIGSVEGFRTRSFAKIKVGIAGGLIGGILGGIALEYFRLRFPDAFFGRLIGSLILGLLIGLFYGLFEKQFSKGVLKLLNGTLKGKEFLLLQNKIRIGSSKKVEIHLPDYKNVAEIHAVLKSKKTDLVVNNVNTEHRVLVNELNVSEHQLKLDDVIQVGSAKFWFFYK